MKKLHGSRLHMNTHFLKTNQNVLSLITLSFDRPLHLTLDCQQKEQLYGRWN